ncbi:glycosyltransferase [Lactococcus lactis]|uniref:Glycosyltransferase 2-like domain-containing protein n=1 Tax=Lactococcus lactis subsp. lactis TaxID=1360 RepID=A0AAC9W7H5_LACLL|nr:glycosyltransferase [Lactococcus lactis]ARE12408.1 glycosyltransferase [Lactococcus lactis subsp. lactis]ARE14820.1 glycosyltransferase [Lactococcus lactis subsp. lactis]
MIFYCVVLYNKKIDEAITIKNLFECNLDNRKIIAFDNSDDLYFREYNSKYYNEKLYCLLQSSNKNVGLSAAYNRILEKIHREFDIENENQYICWLDDDTEISTEFLIKQENAVNGNYDIIVPKIIGQDGIVYSPNEAGKIKNNLVLNNSNKKISKLKFNAINSCLTVKTSIYSNFKFDEHLFLDQVDQLFFDNLRERTFSYKIVDVTIEQQFSQRDEFLSYDYMSRFRIRVKDIIQYGKLSPNNNIFYSYLKNILLAFNFFRKTWKWSYIKIGIISIWSYKK